MKKYAFGVDVGGTTCKIGFFETDGKLIDKWEIKTNKENGGASILSDVAQAIGGKLTEKGISRNDVQGIGVGVPGPVKNDGVVHRCVNVGWGVVNVEKELGDLTGLKVKAGNDANVAALGEMWQGAAKGCRDVIMVTLGTGVGGGIIVDGKVVAGFDGAGGEIGHRRKMVCPSYLTSCTFHSCDQGQEPSSRAFLLKNARFLPLYLKFFLGIEKSTPLIIGDKFLDLFGDPKF